MHCMVSATLRAATFTIEAQLVRIVCQRSSLYFFFISLFILLAQVLVLLCSFVSFCIAASVYVQSIVVSGVYYVCCARVCYSAECMSSAREHLLDRSHSLRRGGCSGNGRPPVSLRGVSDAPLFRTRVCRITLRLRRCTP